MSLLFSMLSRLVIPFLPRSKYLLVSCLQSPSAVILEPKTIKSVTVSIVFQSICHEVMGRMMGCLRRPYKYLWKEEKQKNKGEKERYKHLNTEFQRIARRDKKGFLSDQCKQIEESNRMGKTRDLFISCKDGHNKGQKWYGPNRSRRY